MRIRIGRTRSQYTIEMLKILQLKHKFPQRLSPTIFKKFFVERDCNYNLRGSNFLNRRRGKSVRYSTESVSFLAPKISDFEYRKQTEAAVHRCFSNEVFWKFFQYSQENTCVGVSFFRPATLLKWDSNTGVFLWILRNV